jgi:hypothetical protein
VSILNKEEMPNGAPNTPTLTGPSSGKPNQEYSYNIMTTDPENEQIWYWINWGDGTNTSWLGPFSSGTQITESHTWTTKQNFTITAKTKDIHDTESDLATLIISVPFSYNIPTYSTWEHLFERFPYAFPILRQLLRY